jgi:hypothetical protein
MKLNALNLAPPSYWVTQPRLRRSRAELEALYDESSVEGHLRRSVRAAGGKCEKLKGPEGWPDRTCLWPGAICDFVETKRPKGGRYQPLQRRTHARLRALGFRVEVLNTKALVNAYIASRTE